MSLLHVLDHVPRAHPTVGADTRASRVRALEGRWMILLNMDFQELVGLEGIEASLVATFKWARMPNGVIGVRILGIDIDVMVILNMLSKVILALESIVSSISRSEQVTVSFNYRTGNMNGVER
jgi:hypothetical protein